MLREFNLRGIHAETLRSGSGETRLARDRKRHEDRMCEPLQPITREYVVVPLRLLFTMILIEQLFQVRPYRPVHLIQPGERADVAYLVPTQPPYRALWQSRLQVPRNQVRVICAAISLQPA